MSRLTEREKLILGELHEIEGILAEGLGYPHDPDYGWVVGDHTSVTLAMEARRKLTELRETLQGLYEAVHTTWKNDQIEAAVVEARNALGHSE